MAQAKVDNAQCAQNGAALRRQLPATKIYQWSVLTSEPQPEAMIIGSSRAALVTQTLLRLMLTNMTSPSVPEEPEQAQERTGAWPVVICTFCPPRRFWNRKGWS